MKPKVILFDVGKVLIHYPNAFFFKGMQAIMPYIISNPHHYDVNDIFQTSNRIFEKYEECQKKTFEVNEKTMLNLVFELCELEFSISLDEIEEIIWENSIEFEKVANAEELLKELERLHIQTGVICNNDFSGRLVEKKLKELYPNHVFEFVIASSDYGIRKPNAFLFELGIVKSHVESSEIWYIGDKVEVDVAGSKSVGIIPILYKSEHNKYQEIPKNCIVIENLLDLLDYLK